MRPRLLQQSFLAFKPWFFCEHEVEAASDMVDVISAVVRLDFASELPWDSDSPPSQAMRGEDGMRRTVVVIAHRLSTVRNADQIIVMRHGSVSQLAGIESLAAAPAGISTMSRNQCELECVLATACQRGFDMLGPGSMAERCAVLLMKPN